MIKKLFVIPGHGAGDSGAIGNGYRESERVRALATKIKELGGENVILSDFALNSYKNNIIGKELIPKDSAILELHLDSSTNVSARGGHVIINAEFKADKYDNALAKTISDMFPGRSQKIVGRNDLANVVRAAEKGYNYRLMECCFISNAQDIAVFNTKIDELAKKILGCFDIEAVAPKSYVDVKVERLQKGARGKSVSALQILLTEKGYGSFVVDGNFGDKTLNAVKNFQEKSGIGADGIVGVKTWSKLLGD